MITHKVRVESVHIRRRGVWRRPDPDDPTKFIECCVHFITEDTIVEPSIEIAECGIL